MLAISAPVFSNSPGTPRKVKPTFISRLLKGMPKEYESPYPKIVPAPGHSIGRMVDGNK